MAQSELARRVAVAAVGIPFAGVVVYAGGWVLGVVLALVAAGAALELYRLAGLAGVRPFGPAGAAVAAALVLVAAAQPTPRDAVPLLWLLTIGSLLVLAVASIWARGVAGRPLSAVAVTLFGALYPGGTLAYALFLRHLIPEGGNLSSGGLELAGRGPSPWPGVALVAFPLLLTWVNDSCAYFAGRRWGRRRLIPAVSPGKTVVGSVAGVVGTALVGMGYAALIFRGGIGLPIGIGVGAVGGVLLAGTAQVGDLVESLLKREAGVKDSGHLFPGHGGVLDRFDALFLTFPVAFWFLTLVLTAGDGGP